MIRDMTGSFLSFCRRFETGLLWLAFCLLVLCGITGSSLGWYRQDPFCSDVISLQGEKLLFGRYRGIRGDEFIAHGTPNALAQYNASPRFLRFNPSLGISGRDLLVLHDTGAPVRDISMIGRPACWGFFFLDLRRALAWYWWLPLFLALHFTLLFVREIFTLPRSLSWLIALGIVLTPCAAAWSFWPDNNMAGIMVASYALLRFSRGKSVRRQFVWGLLGAWGVFCAAMSLYFPRLLSIGMVVFGAALAVILSEPERRKGFARPQSWGAGAAAMLPLLLLIVHWRIQCGEALCALNSTVYPGMRRCCGGDLAPFELMRGWLAPLTICRTPWSNQSESQAPQALCLPLLIWFFRNRKYLLRPALWYTLGGVMIFQLVYQFIGFPEFLAKITFWERANPGRCMMALNLGQFLLLAQICEDPQCRKLPPMRNSRAILLGFGAAAASFALLFSAPAEIRRLFLDFYRPLILSGVLLFSFLILSAAGSELLKRPKNTVIMMALFAILTGAAFNPVCLAPQKVSSALLNDTQNADSLKYGGRVLFATGNDFAAVCHYLGGGRSLNGYFMYPDEKMHKILFSGSPDPERFRRMNHLDALIDPAAGKEYDAQIPHNERILLRFSPAFDFRTLPIDFLVIPGEQKELMAGNESVQIVRETRHLALFRVR